MIIPKVLFAGAGLFFAVIIVLVSAIRLAQPSVLNPDFSTQKVSEDYKEEASSSALRKLEKSANYQHPGILPNHPLYWLKMVRDRVMLMTAGNARQRFELLNLYANKRITAGTLLMQQGDEELGATTIQKAEKYLYEASILLDSLVRSNTVDQTRISHFALDFQTHNQVIQELKQLFPEIDQSALDISLTINETVYKSQVEKYLIQ